MSNQNFFEVDLSGMDKGVREVQGFSSDNKFIRQKEHLATFGQMVAFKILPPTANSIELYREKKTLPFAALNHGWFIHPTKMVDDGNGGKKAHRFFHVSPKSLGDIDELEQFLNDTLHELPGYLGAPEEVVDETVKIFRALYTNKNPQYKHLGGPPKKQTETLIKKASEQYPGYATEDYRDMVLKVRQVWQIYKLKYLMPIVMVGLTVEEGGKSTPLTNDAQLLDFEAVIKNAIFHPTAGLIAQNMTILTPEVANIKKQPFGAYKQFFANDAETATYDIILECFENRQFVGSDPNKKGYADFRAYFRDKPTELENAEHYYAEENRFDLLEEVRRGIRNTDMVRDTFKVHFGMLDAGKFDTMYAEESTDGKTVGESAAKTAAQIAEEVKKKQETKEEEVTGDTEETATEAKEDNPKLAKLVLSIESLENIGVSVPQSLLDAYKDITGVEWGTEKSAEEEAPKDVKEEPKTTQTTKVIKTTKTTDKTKAKGTGRKKAKV